MAGIISPLRKDAQMPKVKIFPNKNAVIPTVLLTVGSLVAYEYIVSPYLQKQRAKRLAIAGA